MAEIFFRQIRMYASRGRFHALGVGDEYGER